MVPGVSRKEGFKIDVKPMVLKYVLITDQLTTEASLDQMSFRLQQIETRNLPHGLVPATQQRHELHARRVHQLVAMTYQVKRDRQAALHRRHGDEKWVVLWQCLHVRRHGLAVQVRRCAQHPAPLVCV